MMERQRQQDLFHAAIWPHRATVLRTALLLSRGDAAEAEDLAQETLLRAFRFIERFSAGTDARAWLLAILRNVRIDRLRKRQAESRDVSLDQLAVEPPAGEEALVSEVPGWERPQEILEAFSDRQIIDALQELPEEIRWTLLLVDVEQMDHREAAEILDVPVGTIKSRAHRGRAMLRQALAPLVDAATKEKP